MKNGSNLSGYLLLVMWIFGAGCASLNVNPATPKAHTGYVDLYADSTGELSWQVVQMDPGSGKGKTVFFDLKPPRDKILRFAFPPGQYLLQVTFLNQAIEKPVEFKVDVQEGMVTPVLVRLEEAGTTSVQTREYRAGPTYGGKYGKRTKHGAYEGQMFRIKTDVHEPVLYRTKEQMPYNSSSLK